VAAVTGKLYLAVSATGGGGTGSGTRFLIGFTVLKYAYIAFRSSSVRLRKAGHGVGGRTGRDVPMCFPTLIDFTITTA
jgi:hypothetical protein